MKKIYSDPEAKLIVLNSSDIICSSTCDDSNNDNGLGGDIIPFN